MNEAVWVCLVSGIEHHLTAGQDGLGFPEVNHCRLVKEVVTHYNRGRPHSALGPGFRNHPKPRSRPAHIDRSFPQGPESTQRRCSVGCITNIGWS